MKRAFSPLSVITVGMLLLLLATTGWTAFAQQPPQPAIQAACPQVLKAGIPFAWLRFEPSSFAAYTVTLLPGQTVQANDPPTLSWDGSQWWVYVYPTSASGRGYFWVELNSLEARCQTSTPTPTPGTGTGAANWQAGNTVRVRLNVPFVWFRAAPAPGNPPTHTVLPGTQLSIMQALPVQDSFAQWWWLMRDSRTGFTGWVEQSVVELVSSAPPTTVPSGSWQVGDTVRVRLNVPFVWLRFSPTSASGFGYTARPGQYLFVQQGPQSDNSQNWWMVSIPGGTAVGWVEANSLEFVRRGQ
jgi:hypothetical protein